MKTTVGKKFVKVNVVSKQTPKDSDIKPTNGKRMNC